MKKKVKRRWKITWGYEGDEPFYKDDIKSKRKAKKLFKFKKRIVTEVFNDIGLNILKTGLVITCDLSNEYSLGYFYGDQFLEYTLKIEEYYI